MNSWNATFFLYVVCVSFHKCLSEVSLFEEVTKLPTFVDKTHIIKLLFTERDRSSFFLFTCPKGFGKSVNLDMIRRFTKIYRNHAEENRTRDLFKNLKIGRDEEFFDTHFGKYAVIFIDLQTPTTADTYDKILDVIRDTIKRLYSEYEWLYEQNLKNVKNLSKTMRYYKQLFEIILYENPRRATDNDLGGSVYALLQVIKEFHVEKIILLVDEYDSPILQAMMNESGTEAVALHISLSLSIVLRNINKPCHYNSIYVLISGITNTAAVAVDESPTQDEVTHLESIHLLKYDFLDSHIFYDYCGFTQNEIENIFNKPRFHINVEEKLTLKNCYNGYISDKDSTSIYNPFYFHRIITERKNVGFNKKIQKCRGVFDTDRDTTAIFEKFHVSLNNEYVLSIVANLIRNHPLTFQKKDNISDSDRDKLESSTKNQPFWVNAPQSFLDIFFSYLFQFGYLTKVNNFRNKTWYKAPNDIIIANLGIILTRYLKNYPNTKALLNVDKIFSNILSNQIDKEKAEEALKIALNELFKPVYETTGLDYEDESHNEFNFHSQMYTSVLYGYWIRNLFYVVDGQTQIERKSRGDRKFRYFDRNPGMVNILMESFDRKNFLFVAMGNDKISGIEEPKKLTSNLPYKVTLIVHEEHPEKLPETLLYLSINPLKDKTIQVAFLPSLNLVQNISIDTDILAIYEETLPLRR